MASAPITVSGIHPHLAVFNDRQGECGIGAVVPWAGRLWMLTYPPHEPKGSPDKLYSIDEKLNLTIHPQSVGGTHAGRLIHRDSNQLIIGPYFIDAAGKVRAADVKTKLVGRMTGIARHLTDPANKVYFYDMEGAVYEVDVHTLAVNKLFDRAAPGAHGKGAYTGQGRLIISNNGDKGPNNVKPAAPDTADPKDKEAAGALAEWDGKGWTILERHPFTDITGPGGIHGAPADDSSVWAIGWDKRSVLLKLLDEGKWSTFRLPKASHAYDPLHGWFTEWPRIREIAAGEAGRPGRMMMDMHGMFYDFPAGFSAGNTGGIAPISSHLRYIPDFCHWNGKLVLASDDTSAMQNPMAGQSQSNLWIGSGDELKSFGPASAWGGVWLNDPVKAGEASLPFLVNGFHRRVLHLYHDGPTQLRFKVEIDAKGDSGWTELTTVAVPATGYAFEVLNPVDAQWVRVTPDKDCRATAYFHLTSNTWPAATPESAKKFAGLADVGEAAGVPAIVRPAWHNRNLQVFKVSGDGGEPTAANVGSFEVDGKLKFVAPTEDRTAISLKVATIKREFEVDDASVIMTHKGQRYRLPKGDAAFDKPFAAGWPRAIREIASERLMMNVHGTFYEMPRTDGLPLIKPVASHRKQIYDFCTWRGLLVLSGAKPAGKGDGHTFASDDGKAAVWFGQIDDLWSLGAPVGVGGPWARTRVTAGERSDPYLMTNYLKKRVELSHESAGPVAFTIEVDVDHRGWHRYQTVTVPAGQTVTHDFPAGYSAHWARVSSDQDCTATARFVYEK